ncbi:MAG: hypothetical protein ACOC8D_02080 [bacterium]
MTTRRRRIDVCLGFLAAACLVGCVAGLARHTPANLGRGPMAIFDNECTRCHGVYPEFYRKDLQTLHGQRLRETLVEMMRDRSQLEASEADVDAMVAYHEALRKNALFLCVCNGAEAAAGAATLRGEVTAGAAVELRKDGEARPVSVEGSAWTLAGPPAPPFELVARKGQAEVRLAFPRQQWATGGVRP